MGNDDLPRLLAEVHERLAKTSSLDEQSRRLLTTLMHDIEKALSANDGSSDPNRPRLESFAIEFQAEHPALAETLRRLVDALGKAGI